MINQETVSTKVDRVLTVTATALPRCSSGLVPGFITVSSLCRPVFPGFTTVKTDATPVVYGGVSVAAGHSMIATE